MRRFQFLALLVVSLFTTNLSAQQPGQPGSIPFRPPFPNQGPAKPDTPEAIAEFNVIYDLLQSAFSNPIEESVRQVAAFSKKYPDTAAAYALLGELKYIQFQMAGGCGMSDEVVMLAQKAIMTNQRSAEGYTLAAKAALCNRNAAWYRFADNALAIAPNKPEALYVKARVLEQQGDYKESEVFFRRTLDLMKTPHRKSNIYYWLGRMLTSDERPRENIQADLGKAEEAYRKMVELSPDNKRSKCGLAGFLIKFRPNVDEAIRLRQQDEQAGASCKYDQTELADYSVWANKYLAGKESAKSLQKVVQATGLLPDDAFIVAARFPARGEVVRALLKAKVISNIDTIGSGNDRGIDGCCPAIINASFQGDRELTALLLKNGANINAQDNRKRTPLFYALSNNDVKLTEFLLANGARPNTPYDNGAPLLLMALVSDHKSAALVEVMLQYKANPNSVHEGRSMLHHAVMGNKSDALKVLLAFRADPNLGSPISNRAGGPYNLPPFGAAAFIGRVDAAALLLAAGAKDDIEGRDGLAWLRSQSAPADSDIAKQYKQIAALIEASRSMAKPAPVK